MIKNRAERTLRLYIEDLKEALLSALNSSVQKLLDPREMIRALSYCYYPRRKELIEDLGKYFPKVLKDCLRTKVCFLEDPFKISKVFDRRMAEVYERSFSAPAIGRIVSSEFSKHLDPILNVIGPLRAYPKFIGSPIASYEMRDIIEVRTPYRVVSLGLDSLARRVKSIVSDLEKDYLKYPTRDLSRITYYSDLYEVAFTDAWNVHAPETKFRIEMDELSKEEKKIFKEELIQLVEMYDFILVSGTLSDTWVQGFPPDSPYFVKGLHLHQREEWFIRTREGIIQIRTTDFKNPGNIIYILRRFLEVSPKF